MSLLVTAGQRGDSPQFRPVLEKIRLPRIGPGHPRRHPARVRADKAYGSRAYRAYLRRRGISCMIPLKADQIRHGFSLTVRIRFSAALAGYPNDAEGMQPEGVVQARRPPFLCLPSLCLPSLCLPAGPSRLHLHALARWVAARARPGRVAGPDPGVRG